ncbi:hypothetical protein [Cesiribacter sp. SM1]|uniref:hypothetical protein n=1 Tax=Cesiribacter sp. SM1 TaxID=2861196 RepID=UPI001CD6855D|nr:hypothetical protein [Cesiribacter sp. SM1]
MKKLTLTLSALAFSTVLFAQSGHAIADAHIGLEEAPANASASYTNDQWENNCSDSQSESISLQHISEESTAECSSSLPPRKRHNVPNKAYSVRGGVSYITSFGLRLGANEGGLTIKHLLTSNTAIEGILSTSWRYRGARVTGLFEKQRAIGSEGFYWMWGVGAHGAYETQRPWNSKDCNDDRYVYNGEVYNCDGSKVTAGIDALIGFEYHFSDAPFTAGIDLKPSLDLLGWGSRNYGDAAFTIRYVF